MELQQGMPQFEAAGVWVAAISYDPVGALALFGDEQGITYDLLSDEGSRLIRQLGILNTLVEPDEPVYGIPYPGSYLVDERGVVMAKFFHREYQLREATSVLLEDGFGVRPDLDDCPSATMEEGSVRVTAWLGAADLKFKQLVNLHVRIALGTTLHVSDLESEGELIPLAVRVTSPADVRIGEPRYPATMPLLVTGLRRPLQMIEGELDVSVALLSNVRDGDSVPFDIEVEYEACGEDECVPPRTVRLRLHVPVGALNRAARPAG